MKSHPVASPSSDVAAQKTNAAPSTPAEKPLNGMHVPEWQLIDLEPPDRPAANFNAPRITIGRDEKNDFVIDQPTVSSLHATIEFRMGSFFLEDQRSSNRTRLNDRKLDPGRSVLLKSGDRITFANRAFKFMRMDQLISGHTVLLEVTNFDSGFDEAEIAADASGTNLTNRLMPTVKQHLKKIAALGSRYQAFVNRYFSEETILSLTIHASENMIDDTFDGSQDCSAMSKNQAFYLVCTLPVPIAKASVWFAEHYGGFTNFVLKWIKSDAYQVTDSNVLCVLTIGQGATHWVTIAIVPTKDSEELVEIMSVDLLTEAEKASLDIEFDDQGRVT
jgi:pSer/pThr/pTyr-binding forkhead associated (FHA) protein